MFLKRPSRETEGTTKETNENREFIGIKDPLDNGLRRRIRVIYQTEW